jgi:hypothetical protein
MRKKFKILYPNDYPIIEKRGQPYHPPANCMIVMNNSGVFFLYNGESYYPSIKKLSEFLYKYDVVWKD